MKKLFLSACALILLPGLTHAKTITCSSEDNTTQIRLPYGPNGEPPPGIEFRKESYFKDFLIIRSPALQTLSMPGSASTAGWTYKGQFELKGKNYFFVTTVATQNADGSAESASWYFKSDEFEEFTVLNCK